MKKAPLFQPIRIGRLEIKNRIVMAPINLTHLFHPYDGTLPERVRDFYVERAKGGVGLIVTGVIKVENEIEAYHKQGHPIWQVMTPNALTGLAELADHLHSLGTRLFVQLSAGAGRVARGDVIDAGFMPVSSSPNPAFFRPNVVCKALRLEEVEKIVAGFGDAAEMAANAGVDGVEIHGHEGYLIDQFLTALWNQRKDRYGGDLTGRTTIAEDILGAIRGKVGEDFPVGFRFAVKHFISGPWKSSIRPDGFKEMGRDLSEAKELSARLESIGYDVLHTDIGCYEAFYWAHPPTYQPGACSVDLLSALKHTVNIPLIAVGKLGNPKSAEHLLRTGSADMIALGRPLLADPSWAHKVKEGRSRDIRPCIGCHEACFRLPATAYQPMSCSVNPACARERTFPLLKSPGPKRVLVIGGGVAGMEAARIATLRGHHVTLFEKSGHFGGHLREACVPAFKEDLKRLLEWYERQMDPERLQIHLNREVTPSLIRQLDFDVSIMATGSQPHLPGIPGIRREGVATCSDVLLGKRRPGENVMIIGAGLEGCETAVWLAHGGKSVFVVEKLDHILTQVHFSNRQMLLDMLQDCRIKIATGSEILEVMEGGVRLKEKDRKEAFVPCDTLISAAGLKPVRGLHESLIHDQRPFYQIGDCKEPRNIHHAVLEGFHVGHAL